MRASLLGLDASKSNTGWAALDLISGKPILCGRVDLDRMRGKPRPSIGLEEAYWCAMDGIYGALESRGFTVELIYIERHFSGRNRQVTVTLAEAVGTARMAAYVEWPGVSINHFVPQTWKTALGLRHNASKEEYIIKARELGWEFEGDNDDAAAAGCIASAGWKENEKGSYG